MSGRHYRSTSRPEPLCWLLAGCLIRYIIDCIRNLKEGDVETGAVICCCVGLVPPGDGIWSGGVTCSSVPGIREDLLSISVRPWRPDGPRCGQTAAEFLRPGCTESLGRAAQVNKHTSTRWFDQLRDCIKNYKLFLHLKWTLHFLHCSDFKSQKKIFLQLSQKREFLILFGVI